ncbi:MAG: tetratricopeptide repeat protein [Salinibacter sp.]
MVPRRLPSVIASALALFVVLGAPTAQAQSSGDAEAAFARAVQFHQQRLYADAMSAFSTFRDGHPRHVLAGEALYLEAQSALAQGYDDEAARLFEKLEAQYPFHPQGTNARLGLAQFYLDAGEIDEAERQLSAVIDAESGPQVARALYLRAQLAREQGNLTTALRDYERAYEEHPESEVAPAALSAAGATQVRQEQYDAAAASFEQLGQSYPDSPYAQNLGTALAEVYYRLEDYEQVVSALTDRISALSGDEKARALFLLAESYNQLGQGEDAEVQYQQVIEEHPDSPYVLRARYGMAWQHYRDDQFERAAEAFSDVQDAPSSTEGALADRALYYEAASRAQAGQMSQAVEQYQTAAERMPDHRLGAEALYEAGLLLYQQEDYDAAAASFQSVLDEFPDASREGDAARWRGNALLAGNRVDDAREAYEQAQSLDAVPDSLLREAQFQEAWAHYTNARYADAADAFLALTDGHPDSDRGADALFWGADSHFNQDNVARARRLFRRYLDRYEDGSHRDGALYALAWTYFTESEYEPAAQYFQRFLDGFDGTDDDIPYQQDARLRLADSYFALKRYDDAVDLYQEIGGEGADYATYQSAEALNYAGRPEEAIRILERFVDQYESSQWRPEALYQLGSIHFQNQEYEPARTAYRQFLDAYPDHSLAAEARYGIADSYYNAGDMERAVEAYRTVLEEHPNSNSAQEAASGLFFALNASGQQDRTEDLIAQIAEETPDLEDQLRYSRARAAYQSGESDRARSLFQDFVRRSSSDTYLPGAYYYLGLLYADQDQETEATNYLQQLVDEYPDHQQTPEGALRLGDIYRDQEEHEAALTAYQAAAESEKISEDLRAQARYGEAVALLRLDRNDDAASRLNTLLEENDQAPIQASARLGLARIAQDDGRTDEAQDLYRAVIDASDGETGAEALYRLGRLLRQSGAPRQAVEELDRMSSLYGGHPEWIARSLVEQGRAYEQLGETGQAAQRYDEVVESYPSTPFADSARTARESL